MRVQDNPTLSTYVLFVLTRGYVLNDHIVMSEKHTSLHLYPKDQLREQLGYQLAYQLKDSLMGYLWTQLWYKLEGQQQHQLRNQLRGCLWDQLEEIYES